MTIRKRPLRGTHEKSNAVEIEVLVAEVVQVILNFPCLQKAFLPPWLAPRS